MKIKRIAVVGAGLSGLACAYYLCNSVENGSNLHVTLFDPGVVGDNTSGIAAGLLHSYTGAHAKTPLMGKEGLEISLQLLNTVSTFMDGPVFSKTGLLRAAVSEAQKEDFYLCATQNPEVSWLNAEQTQGKIPGIAPEPAIFIEHAYVVDTKRYLDGLWKICSTKGVVWNKDRVTTLSQLPGFDAIIVAAGSSVRNIPELSHLPIRPVKGQLLEIIWPEQLPLPSCPVNSKAYLIPNREAGTCIIGATFERSFTSEAPDPDFARSYLLPKLYELFPLFKEVVVTRCLSGIRGATPNHQPLAHRETSKVWVIAGMGSKGLLYHALYAARVVDSVLYSLAV